MRVRATLIIAAILSITAITGASATMRISDDIGGRINAYVDQYSQVRNSGERMVIDGACLSACTLVLGIVPLNKICVTPRASMGFHQAYYDRRYTAGLYVQSYAGTDELMSYYPETLKEWIAEKGGLARQMKTIKNGSDLWAIIDPCPDEF